MSKIRLYGDTSGYVDVSAPAVADNRNIDLPSVLDSKLNLAGGKILQIVRATDSTSRSTTSTSYVDVTGMSVTITPQKSDSAIIVIGTSAFETNSGFIAINLTDNSDNALSGAQGFGFGDAVLYGAFTLIGYSTPATTSATTYKMRFKSSAGATVYVRNNQGPGQMYAIEVSA